MTGDGELCVGQHVPVRCHRCALAEIMRLKDLETEYDDTFEFLLRVMRQRNHAVFAIQCFRQRALIASELHVAITDWLTGAGFDLIPDHNLIADTDDARGEQP